MSKCKCSMAISMTGDGCRYCQPQEYIDRMSEWLQESRDEVAAIEAERDQLKAENERLSNRLVSASWLYELDTLRESLNEARELVMCSSEIIHEQCIHIDRPMTALGSESLTRIDDWLEANKP